MPGLLDPLTVDENLRFARPNDIPPAFGMKERTDRLTLLPRRARSVVADEGWIAPQILYDVARAITAPARAYQGQQPDAEEGLNVGFNLMGAGYIPAAAGRRVAGQFGAQGGSTRPPGSEVDLRDLVPSEAAATEAGLLAPPTNAMTPAQKGASTRARKASEAAAQAKREADARAGNQARGTEGQSIANVNIRGMSAGQGLTAARAGQHIRQDPRTGQFIGYPEGVNSMAGIQAMRDRYDALVDQGDLGGDWYARARQGTDELGLSPENAHTLARMEANTSAEANPDVNLGFTLQAWNALLRDQPLPDIVHTGRQARGIFDAVRGGTEIPVGRKTDIYGQQIDPTVPYATTGANDIWHSRNWGYRNPDGSQLSKAPTAAQHTVMDAETLLAAERANARKAGGRTDWDGPMVQAAPWIRSKALDLQRRFPKKYPTYEAALKEAAKTYRDYYPKYTAYDTVEDIPGAGTGQFPGLLDADRATREAFSRDPRGNWRDPETGHDILSQEAGLLNLPTLDATGSFTPKGTGIPETQPMNVVRNLVDFSSDAGGKTVHPGTQKMLQSLSALRAYFDVQNAGAGHKLIPDAKAGVRDSFSVPTTGKLTQAQMRHSQDVASRMTQGQPVDDAPGLFAADTTNALSLMRPGWLPGPKGADLNKQMKELGSLLEGDPNVGPSLFPGARSQISRRRLNTWYNDFEAVLAEGNAGSGKATQLLRELVSDPDVRSMMARVDDSPRVRQVIAGKIERDAERMAKTGDPNRADMETARQLFVDGGLKKLFDALDRGDIVPAVALPVVGYLLSEQEVSDDDA